MKTIICDIDGTIADCSHRLHYIQSKPKRWDKFFSECHNDKPIWPIINLIKTLVKTNCIIFVSGRSDECRIQTIKWLNKIFYNYNNLFMRKAGDYRQDYIVKQEIYDTHLKTLDIWFILDDRDQVVQMWRRNGFTCLQVANGNF